ncbi:hypothetical protein IFM89_025908 [Coptis chinensis]|uniref:Uncharacterized protein n=1 Tax=Coptis chinensis TaxID=261450 RepID=A0A835LST0_9MAGN|nr:hypothetical protein IFM89_025908 [Coptis chinensis]
MLSSCEDDPLLCLKVGLYSLSVTCAGLDKKLELYRRVESTIVELGRLIDSVWAMKPLVGGKEIMKVLQLKDGNDQVGKWVNRLVKWELSYPSGTKQEYL